MQIETYNFVNLCAVPIANCAGADQGACPCPWQKAEKNCCVVNLLRGYQPPAGLKNSHWFLGFGTTFPDKKQKQCEYLIWLYILYYIIPFTYVYTAHKWKCWVRQRICTQSVSRRAPAKMATGLASQLHCMLVGDLAPAMMHRWKSLKE